MKNTYDTDGMNDPTATVTIYVYLLDEGVDVWAPVEAEPLKKDLYHIISKNPYPEDEKWQFTTEDIVLCEKRNLNGGPCLVAVSKANLP